MQWLKLVFSYTWGSITLAVTKSFYLPVSLVFMPRSRGGQAGGRVHKAHLSSKAQKIPSVQSLKSFQEAPDRAL